jgi:Tfp pilus assembly protein PilO
MAEEGLSADTMAMLGAGALGVAALAGLGMLAAGMMGGLSEADMLRKKIEMLQEALAIENIAIDEFEKYLDQLKDVKTEFGMLAKNTEVQTDELCNYLDFVNEQMTDSLAGKKEDEEDMLAE